MRIAIFSFEFPPQTAFGGIGTYSVQLADTLSQAGHDVEVFAGGKGSDRVRRKSGALVHTVGCTDQLDFALPAARAFLVRHDEEPFEVIETPEYQAPALAALKLAPEVASVVRLHTPTFLISRINTPRESWRLPIRQVLGQAKAAFRTWRAGEAPRSIHLAHGDLRDSWEIDRLEAEQARRCDLICSPSRDLVGFPHTKWRLPEEKTKHLPNLFEAHPRLRELPVPGRGKTLGYFGRLEERKGIETLLAALPKIAAQHPDLTLVCVGQSCRLPRRGMEAAEVISSLCRQLGISCSIPGRVAPDEVPSWLGRCRVVMLPSVWENFPYACLEAMVAGCAVIGSSAGGMADMIEPEIHGLLAKPGDAEAFAAHASRLLADEELAVGLGRAARARVEEEYSPRALLPRYESAYRQAIAARLHKPTELLSQS